MSTIIDLVLPVPVPGYCLCLVSDTASVCVRNDFLISDEEDMVAAAVMLMGVYMVAW